MRRKLPIVVLLLLPILAGCVVQDDEAKKKMGICIHSLVITPKPTGCTGAAGTPAAYSFCSDENKTEDCTNLSVACLNDKVYEDTIVYYDGGKRCDTSGYTITCSSNSKYKAADSAFCPP